MIEALNLLDKQLQEIRNMIQGSRGRVDKLNEKIVAEESMITQLLEREVNLNNAINKLRN